MEDERFTVGIARNGVSRIFNLVPMSKRAAEALISKQTDPALWSTVVLTPELEAALKGLFSITEDQAGGARTAVYAEPDAFLAKRQLGQLRGLLHSVGHRLDEDTNYNIRNFARELEKTLERIAAASAAVSSPESLLSRRRGKKT